MPCGHVAAWCGGGRPGADVGEWAARRDARQHDRRRVGKNFCLSGLPGIAIVLLSASYYSNTGAFLFFI